MKCSLRLCTIQPHRQLLMYFHPAAHTSNDAKLHTTHNAVLIPQSTPSTRRDVTSIDRRCYCRQPHRIGSWVYATVGRAVQHIQQTAASQQPTTTTTNTNNTTAATPHLTSLTPDQTPNPPPSAHSPSVQKSAVTAIERVCDVQLEHRQSLIGVGQLVLY